MAQAAKLALNLPLTGLVLVAPAPEVADAAQRGRQFDAGLPAALGVDQPVFPPIVSSTALLVAMALAVFKPWGRSVVPAGEEPTDQLSLALRLGSSSTPADQAGRDRWRSPAQKGP